MSDVGRVLQRVVVAWALLALLGWGLIFLGQGAVTFPQISYYIVLFLVVGMPLWLRRDGVRAALQRWRLAPLPRYLLLGYGMVLIEEIIAATVNHAMEGFNLATLPVRIGQFWAFNILAFTGFIWGWYLLRAWFVYTPREVFFLTGCWGLFAEHTYAYGPLIFLLLAPLNILTYGLILSPAMLSLPPRLARHASFLITYPLAFIIPFLASLAPLIVLITLRTNFPGWFPPCNMIQC